MKLKSDINLLRAAGNKQKIQSKAPLQLILIVIVVGVVGFLGYMFFSQSQKITTLQNTINTSKRTINNTLYAEIVEKNTETADTTAAIREAIEYADKLAGYYDTQPAMFPELSAKHVDHLNTYVAQASNSSVESLTYTNATIVIAVRSAGANMETDVVEKLLASNLFRKAGYKCPVCGKVTYYTVTPAAVYCNYDHYDLPDVETTPNEDGTYTTTYVCALKNIVDICVSAPILTSNEVTVARPTYSSVALSIEATSTSTVALKNYYDSLFDSGYFSKDYDDKGFQYQKTNEEGVYVMKLTCLIPQPEIKR